MKILLTLEQELDFPLKEGNRKQVWLYANLLKKKCNICDIQILTLNYRNLTQFFKSYKKEDINIKGCGTLLKFPKVDVLHHFGAPSPLLIILFNLVRAKKVYLTITDGEVGRFWESKFSLNSLHLIRRKCNKIFIQTKYQYNLIKRFFDEDLLKIIPPVIPTLKSVSEKSKIPRILFMSHLSEEKGVEELLLAYKKLIEKDKSIELVVADSKVNLDEKRNYYLDLIKRINLHGGKITLRGYVNPSVEMSKAWIYVYPIKKAHLTFSVPLSIYEALQCNTLPLVTNVGGIKEYINPKFLFEKSEPKEIYLKINKYLNMIKDNKLLNWKKEILKKNINNEEIINKYLKEYKE